MSFPYHQSSEPSPRPIQEPPDDPPAPDVPVREPAPDEPDPI